MLTLTQKQDNLLNYIVEYIIENNRSPSVKDIKEYFKFKSPQSVVDVLNALERKKYIQRLENARGIIIVEPNIHLKILITQILRINNINNLIDNNTLNNLKSIINKKEVLT